jgi:hypothetical protein
MASRAVGGLLGDLPQRAGEVEAGAHGEGHEVDGVGQAAVHLLEAPLDLARHLQVREDRAEAQEHQDEDAADVAERVDEHEPDAEHRHRGDRRRARGTRRR